MPATAPSITAAFSPTTITTAQTSTLTLTITNTNASTALTGVAVAAAALPANLTGSSASTTCSGGTATYNSGTRNLSLSGGSLAAGTSSSCTVTLTVSSTVPSTYSYTTGAVSSTESGSGSTATTPTSLTVNASVPGAPTIGAATAGDAQATVTFTAPASDGASSITSYTVTSSPSGITATGASSPITVTGLSNGTAYTFTVTATNGVGTGSASAASNSVTPKADQTITFNNPGSQNFGTTPTLTATASSTLTVSFSSTTPGVCTITAGGALTFNSVGSCTIDADQAGNAATNAAPTVSQTFAVNAVVPGAPTIGTATAGVAQATVTFTAPTSDGGSAITGYTVTSSPSGFTGTGASSPITVTGLSNGTAYTFTVTATNGVGTGPASAASNSVTPKADQTITFNNPGSQNFGTTPTLSATASSTLTVSFSSTTSAVCSITSGGALTFNSVGSCTIDADQAGDTATNAAPTVSQTFAVVAVVPGAPTIGTATAGDAQATVTFTAPASNGGAAITNYTVTSSPTGITGTGANSPITVMGLANGTAYTFTVTADNTAGTGPASAASNSVTPLAVPTAGNKSGVTATYNSSSNPTTSIDFTGDVTNASFVRPISAPSHGTLNVATGSNAAGLTLVYTPTAGYRGADSFTYRAVASDGTTVSVASATVSITVGDPTLVISLSGSGAQQGTALSGYSISTTGGAAPYSCNTVLASGALPGGVSLTPGCALTGTPSASGTFNFTVDVTDSSTGTGPFTQTSGGLSLVVAVATPTASNRSGVTATYNSGANPTVSIDLTANVTNASFVRPITAPAHGTLDVATGVNAAGLTLVYTPTVGYRGTDSFTYRGVASDGTTLSAAAATVSITVGDPTLVISLVGAGAQQGVALAGYSISTSGGASPYTCATSVASGALPAGVSLTSACALTGTPSVSGTFNFTVSVTDSSTGTGPFTQTSGALSLVVAVGTPVAANKSGVTATYNSGSNPTTTINFASDVTFASFVRPVSAPSHGTLNVATNANAAGLTLIYTPTAGYRGADSFTYRAVASDGTTLSASAATVSITVGDPTFVASLPVSTGTLGVAFSQQVTMTGGTSPYSAFSATGLPPGLSISGSGLISGTPTTAGTYSVIVTATDASSGSPFTGTAAAITVTIAGGAQTISFTSTPPSPATVGSTYTVAATATSGLAVAFSIDAASTAGACSVSGNTVTFTGAGTCRIDADQPGNGIYTAAAQVTQVVTVAKQTSTTTLTASKATAFVGEAVTLTATVVPSTVQGTVTFKEGSGTLCSAVALTNGAASCVVKFGVGGPHSVTATFNGSSSYLASTSAALEIDVTDQTVQTVTTIATFMAHRNNLLAGSFFDEMQGISRLEQFGGSQSFAGQGGPVVPGNFAAEASGAGAARFSPRLGVGSDGSTLADAISGFASRSGRGASLADQLSPISGFSDQDPGPLATPAGPLSVTGSGDDTNMRFGFSTSLGAILKNEARKEQEKIKAAGAAALAFGGDKAPFAQAAQMPFDIWVEGKYTGFGGDTSLDGHFGLLTVGADYIVNRSLLIGAFVQFDDMRERDQAKGSDVESLGWMAGPYMTTRLSSHLYWQARAAWGTSTVDISPFQTYTDSFETERWFASTKLTGRWQMGPWTLSPAASVTYVSDTSEAYRDQFGALIPAVSTELGQAKIGPEVSYQFAVPNGMMLEPHGKLELIWDFAEEARAAGLDVLTGETEGFADVRGRVELGLRASTLGGTALDFTGSYDGIGSSGTHAISGRASVNIPLN